MTAVGGAIDFSTAWQSPQVAESQAHLMLREYLSWRNGSEHNPFNAFCHLVKIAAPVRGILEVGCGAGIYSKVCAEMEGVTRYVGCDFSPHMIREATKAHPHKTFVVADGTKLPFADKSFQVVCVSALINVCDEWEAVLAEAKRVTSSCVLVHRVPSYLGGEPMRIVEQDVYGQRALERRFEEQFIHSQLKRLVGEHVEQRFWGPPESLMGSYLLEVG